MSHPTELRRGGLWAGWQITGHSCCYRDCRVWRRWITHQRSSVNHQSPLTSHHRHRHPLTGSHSCTRTLEEDTAQNLTRDEFCWRINSNSERTPPPVISCSSLSISLLLSSCASLSLPHIASPVISVPAFLFVTCSSLTCFARFPISLHLCIL